MIHNKQTKKQTPNPRIDPHRIKVEVDDSNTHTHTHKNPQDNHQWTKSQLRSEYETCTSISQISHSSTLHLLIYAIFFSFPHGSKSQVPPSPPKNLVLFFPFLFFDRPVPAHPSSLYFFAFAFSAFRSFFPPANSSRCPALVARLRSVLVTRPDVSF